MKALFGAIGLWLMLAAGATAQTPQPIPPAHYSTDERGIDLTSGTYQASTVEVVIGVPGEGGLAYGRTHFGDGWRDNMIGTINSSGSSYTVSVGPHSDVFTGSGGSGGGPFTNQTNNGATLVFAAGLYTYTSSTGVEVVFNPVLRSTPNTVMPYAANVALAERITSPNGEEITYGFLRTLLCVIGSNGICRPGGSPAIRLEYISSNRGYELAYAYQYNGEESQYAAQWVAVQSVTGFNRGVDWCDRDPETGAGCFFSQTWPSVTYGTVDATTQSATDEMGRQTLYRSDAEGRLTGMRLPGAAADAVTVSYTAGLVDEVSDATGTWDYQFGGAGSGVTATVTGPQGQAYETEAVGGLIQSYTDAFDEETTFSWTAGRLTEVVYPEGNSVEYTYDARGNLTETRQVAEPGSGLADIVTTATYAATCANVVICNLPTATTDTLGRTTDYVWNPTHGGLESVTPPPMGSGQDRPQTRISYAQFYAWYRRDYGWIAQAPTPVWLPVQTSACQSGVSPACIGTANERVNTVAYQTGSASQYSNLLPTGATAHNGTSSVVATTTTTWTANGDAATVDGPLAGSGDVTRYLYNAGRELIGAIGPDPDGAGGLAHRAIRITRNSLGLATLTEQGTTPGYTDANWAAFTSLQRVIATYDPTFGRPLSQALSDGTTTFSLVQQSYDASGRADCTAVRMNPATFGPPPASACSYATAGAFGPDRIGRVTYDAMGRVAATISGLGLADEITEAVTWTPNGQPETLTDGAGHVTTLAYDGFGRAQRMYYPNAAGSGSSGTDYVEWTYDAGGQLVGMRQRDGQTFTYQYNGLGLLAWIYGPGSEPDRQLGYNLFGQQNYARTTGAGGQTMTWTHDALGRTLSETGPRGVVAWQWDAAGRNTRLTWPDGFYAAYDYDLTGAMTAVRENGATSGAGVLATYAYDNLGRRTGMTRGNGTSTAWGWDGASRLVSLTNDLTGTGQDATWTLGYNPAGQVTARTLSNTAYAYTGQTTLDNAYANDGLNRVTAVDAASVTYDANQNITGVGATGQFAYDASNRLTGVTLGNGFAYDPAGRLYERSANASRYLYSGGQAIGRYDGSGVVVERYVPGAGLDDYAAYVSAAGTRTWPAQDPLGSVAAILDAAGAASQINAYDEYGVPAAGFSGPFGYAGSMHLGEAGGAPWHMRNRQYHPGLGRFLQTDPIGYQGGMNLYAYVGGDPVNRVDPWGLSRIRTTVWWREQICSRRGPNGPCHVYGETWTLLDGGYGSVGDNGLIGGGVLSRTGGGGGGEFGGLLDGPLDEEACPSVPSPGLGADELNDRVNALAIGRGLTERFPSIPPGTLPRSVLFLLSVPGGYNDTKSSRSPSYVAGSEEFGNFLFGAGAAASGLSRTEALAWAQGAQIAQNILSGRFGRDIRNGHIPSFQDNPGDARAIGNGYDYYQRGCGV